MRPGKGCRSCRERHVRCVVVDGQSTCTRCAESNRNCVFEPRFRFRRVSHVETASQGVRSRTTLDYEQAQEWVPTQQTRKRDERDLARPLESDNALVNFVLEDGSGLEYDADKLDCSRPAPDIETLDRDIIDPGGNPLQPDTPSYPTPDLNAFRTAHHQEDVNQSSVPQQYLQGTGFHAGLQSPASITELTRRHEDPGNGTFLSSNSPVAASYSPAATSPTSLPTPSALTIPRLSKREAFLLLHYIKKIAPWVCLPPLRIRMLSY